MHIPKFLAVLPVVLSHSRATETSEFPIIDLNYTRHAPTYLNQTSLHNITYATYANIRFAQPPLGDLRFRAPKLPPPSNNTLQTGLYARNITDCLNSIPPYLTIGFGLNGTTWGSEDCLFLDVKVPEGVKGGDDVPVLHWLYGGGYIFGSKDWAGNPAGLFQDMMPSEKFITVSSNYRLGALGWMSSEGVDIQPNVGIHDGLVALEWTKKYISRFGGDASQITVIGESAGSGIAQHLLTARGGKGSVPFQQAILTSPGYRPHVNRSSEMTDIYKLFLKATNCSDVACLRKAPEAVIRDANQELLFDIPSSGWLGPSIGYGPIIDGDLVPDLPDRLIKQGKYHKCVSKVLTANMANDGYAGVVTQALAKGWSDFLSAYMRTPTQETIRKVQSVYSNASWDAFDVFNKDAIFACHAYWTAKKYNESAYRYSMSIPPGTHGQDQFYYLYTSKWTSPAEYPDIAKRMQKYFRNFIHRGITGGGEPEVKGEIYTPKVWPSYGEKGNWMNITAKGFEIVHGEVEQAKRCELLLELINDEKNGF